MSRLFSASLLVLGIAFAMPSAAQESFQVLGKMRDTTSGSDWQVKYLGGLNTNCGYNSYYQNTFCTSNETYNWQAQRTYTNGVLNTAGYSTAFRISDSRAQQLHWKTNMPWISRTSNGVDANGYYSFVTIIEDDFSSLLANGDSVTFDGLKVSFASDDHLHAIIVNGDIYKGFNPQPHNYRGWEMGYTSLLLTGIDWNVNGLNTVEFIVHNNNSADYGSFGSYNNVNNASGFSAKIQAVYIHSPIPEPETYAMLLAGLGLIGIVARRRKSQ
jgi:hypothetical protein